MGWHTTAGSANMTIRLQRAAILLVLLAAMNSLSPVVAQDYSTGTAHPVIDALKQTLINTFAPSLESLSPNPQSFAPEAPPYAPPMQQYAPPMQSYATTPEYSQSPY